MRLITRKEIESTAKIFAANTKDINIHKYFFPDESKYSECLYYLYLFYCTYHFDKTFISDDGEGAIIWHPPIQQFSTPTLKDIYSNVSYASKLGMKAISRLISYQLWLTKFKSNILPEPHYYLDIYAVKDTMNNEGIEQLKANGTSDDLINSVVKKAF